MNKNISKVEIMEKGEITKTLLILGIPMIISMLVTALYNIVDTYFVSSLGTQQSAAVTIAQGQTTITLKSMLCGAILNIILDPLFIKYLAMGVKGAAIATLISQIVTLIIYFYFFFIGNSYIKIKLNNFKLTLSIYIEVVKVGMFMFILQVLTGFSITLISNKAKIYGVAAVSAMGIVLRIVALGVNVIFGFMKGYQPFAGYNYGAKNINRVKEITKKAIEITTLYSSIWSIVIFIFSKEIMSIMIKRHYVSTTSC